MLHPLRQRRRALGLSQAELAVASSLSRQQISAIESGRNVPSVEAAIALARVLGTAVEALFATAPAARWEPVSGSAPAPGTPVRAATVGERPVFVPLSDRGLSGRGWVPPDGIYEEGGVRLLDQAIPEATVVAGCDPILGSLAELLPGAGPTSLLPVHATSLEAARALHRDRVHAALVHGTDERLATQTPRSRAFRVAAWRIGLAAPQGAPLDPRAVAEGALRVAHRPVGAEAERALRSFLATINDEVRLVGPVAEGHREAAALVTLGLADVALTMEPVAESLGLEFLPIEEHAVELRVGLGWLEHPGIAALLDLLGSQRLARRIAHIGSYSLLAR